MYVVTHATGERYKHAKRYARHIYEHLLAREQEVVMAADVTVDTPSPTLVIAVGGDGTIMRAMRDYDAPVFGVNAGTIGFLSGAEASFYGWESAIDRIVGGDFVVEKRMALHLLIQRADGTSEGIQPIVNEVAIFRAGRQNYLDVLVNDDLVWPSFHGEGMMVATATGSNAWNRHYRGPRLFPESREVALTPMGTIHVGYVPFALPELSPGGTITLSLARYIDDAQHPEICFDGERRGVLQHKDKVIISAAPEPVRLATFGLPQYFSALRNLGILTGEV